MIPLLHRIFARSATTAPVQRRVCVIDGTETGVGELLTTALATDGVPAKLVLPHDLPPTGQSVVLLLPARAAILPGPSAHIVSIVDTLAAVPIPFTSRIIVTWCVANHDRSRLAAPFPPIRNWSPLLLGTAWGRELAHHAGDENAAVACRSAKIGTLIHTHATLAGLLLDDLCRGLRTLDPHFLHAMTTQTSVPDIWLNLPSITAAIRTRRWFSSAALGPPGLLASGADTILSREGDAPCGS